MFNSNASDKKVYLIALLPKFISAQLVPLVEHRTPERFLEPLLVMATS